MILLILMILAEFMLGTFYILVVGAVFVAVSMLASSVAFSGLWVSHEVLKPEFGRTPST